MNSARNITRCLKASLGQLSNTRSFTSGRSLNMTWSVVRKAPSGLPKCFRDRPSAISSVKFVRPMSTAKFDVINVQDEDDFKKRVVEQSSSIPVVVDFHATWCGPCKILGPRLESLLSKEDGRVLMAKVDIDDHAELAMEYGVRSVPTVVGMKNGKVQNEFVGVKDDDQIGSFVDKLVAS